MAVPNPVSGYAIKYDSTVVGDTSGGFMNYSDRNMKITKDTPVSPAFYNWFMSNAKKIDTTTASLAAKEGIIYTTGISDLSADTLSEISNAISMNPNITNTTTVLYYDKGDVHRKISVADQINIALNETNYAFDIIGFNHDDKTDGSGKAGITFQMHDVFATDYPMNSSNTNVGSWKSSVMRTSTMATMKGYLPPAWQIAIKPVNKASGLGNSSISGVEITSDDCFLLAEIEIFGSANYSVSGEGTQYAYYSAGHSKVKNKNGLNSYWWERSPRSGGKANFCCVYAAGKSQFNKAGSNRGVAFAFCI